MKGSPTSYLAELRVRDLGVIEDLSLLLHPGMTAVTGETGAGKTLVVEAIELLVGGRADATLVRAGAAEARVEGRFVVGDRDLVLTRVVPADGRSRAYVDGTMATVGTLGAIAGDLVELHGQHDHQSLLGVEAQRHALDRHGGIDVSRLREERANLERVEAGLAALGGDSQERARETDLLRYQLAELERAGLSDHSEDERLAEEEDRLANAELHRDAGAAAHAALLGDQGALDSLGRAISAIASSTPLAELHDRARALASEVAVLGGDLRIAAESFEHDPERLDGVHARRQLLRDLIRKYGETLQQVIEYEAFAASMLSDLESHEARAAALEEERRVVVADLETAEVAVGTARRAATPALAHDVESVLHALAMPAARLEIEVGGGAGDDVTFMLGANLGEPALPLARVASGGELSRAMLALRLVVGPAATGEGGPSLVFDEVDAGIGGEAALSVARALAAVAAQGHQVLVITHLPQVAAFADQQVSVTKTEVDGRTIAAAEMVEGGGRIVELSRMLSGQRDSTAARTHAEELLATAAADRKRA